MKAFHTRPALAGIGLALLLMSGAKTALAADPTPIPDEEYEKKIRAAQELSPLGSNFTGENISLYDGSATFTVTDVDLPGNNALPVRVSRKLKIVDRHGEGNLPGFEDWEIDLPRIEGTFLSDRGWKIQNPAPNDYARCSSTALPDVATSGAVVVPLDVWSGTNLYLPGSGEQELLINDQATLPAITDGQTYPWVTTNFTRVRCLAQTATGYPGEAFVAITPDGIKYTFDYVVSYPARAISVPTNIEFLPEDAGGGFSTSRINLPRSHVAFLPTTIEDRFGNKVTYSYSGGHLTSITASPEFRQIILTWVGNHISAVTAKAAAPAVDRTWNYTYVPVTGYTYTNALSAVQQPDLSKWTYSAVGTLKPIRREAPLDGGQTTKCQTETDAREDTNGYQLTIGHPSGATAVFDFDYERTYKTHTPIKACRLPMGQSGPAPYASHYWDGYALTSKTITGPGLAAQRWDYVRYGVGSTFYTSGAPTDACPTCQVSKNVIVTAPDGTYQRYQFGVMYGINEGKLLAVGKGTGTGAPASATTMQYIDTAQVAVQRFPDTVGKSRTVVYSFSNRLRPATQTLLVQDGRAFKSAVTQVSGVYDFDPFARPLKQTKSSYPYVPPQPPSSAPTVVAPGSNATGDYGISWAAISGATTYGLDESLNGAGWIRLQSSSATSLSVSNRDNGTYGYRAQACNAVGCGPYSPVSTTVVSRTYPATPSLMMNTYQTVQPISLQWTPVLAITSYQLDVSIDQGASWARIYSGTATSTSYDQPFSTNYLYRVRACNTNGCGAYSAVRDVTAERDACPNCLVGPSTSSLPSRDKASQSFFVPQMLPTTISSNLVRELGRPQWIS